MDAELREHLRRIEASLEDMSGSRSWSRFLLRGALRGAGFVVGTLFTVALLGWFLGLFGVIEPLSAPAGYLQEILEKRSN